MESLSLLVATCLCALVLPCSAKELTINLKNPVYSGGTIRTDHGGVIEGDDFRIQGQKLLCYTSSKEVQKIFAEGDLMMVHSGQVFVGDRLEFDLKTKTGYLLNGRTGRNAWYMGGRLLELREPGEYHIEDAFITMATNRAGPWKITAESATIDKNQKIQAQNLTLRVGKSSTFWFPRYKGSVNGFENPPTRYKLKYYRGCGPCASFRSRFFSSETLNAFARFDYHFPFTFKGEREGAVGPGGALEAEYQSKDKLTLFQTRNYGALDKDFSKEGNKAAPRYRLQGIYKTKSEDDLCRLHVQYDKLSDPKMVDDFRNDDFELDTQKATYLEATRYSRSAFGSLTVRPDINGFESISEQLPHAAVGLRPIELASTGIISQNYFSAGYLRDYFTKDDRQAAKQTLIVLRDQSSGRFETLNTLYRPTALGPIMLTPKMEFVGIFYTDSPQKKATKQMLYTYGADANFRISRSFGCIKHTVEPHGQYFGRLRPSARVDDHFTFGIDDGYSELKQLRLGVRQLFYSRAHSVFLPPLSLDIYGYSFWGSNVSNGGTFRLFTDLEFNQPSYAILGAAGWNFKENVLDYGNVELLWTLNANVAVGVEFRHRSPFWLRKADQSNYNLDAARSQEELLNSSLSDGRDTLLTKAHLRLTPRWNLHIQSFHGWGRAGEKRYNGARIDLYTMVTGSQQLKLSYEYLSKGDSRFSWSFNLVK